MLIDIVQGGVRFKEHGWVGGGGGGGVLKRASGYNFPLFVLPS